MIDDDDIFQLGDLTLSSLEVSRLHPRGFPPSDASLLIRSSFLMRRVMFYF
jgi:hypothetical protein